MKLYPICHEHDAHGSSPHARCALCDRWWNTYNAALGGLIAFTHDDDGSREFTDECRAEARRIADAEHGALPARIPDPVDDGTDAARAWHAGYEAACQLVEVQTRATWALVKAARNIAPSGCDADALVALLEALKPFEDKP